MEAGAAPERIGAAFRWGASRLKEAGVEGAPRDTTLLLAHASGRDPGTLLLERGARLEPPQRLCFSRLVEERCRRVPVSQLLGRREFMSLEFSVDRRVLTPRPETELLVEEAVRRLQGVERPLVAEAGTGSAAVAVALALAVPGCRVVATDLSADALAVARENVRRYRLAGRVRLCRCHLLDALGEEGSYRLVLSNPPYVSDADYPLLPPEVGEHEPEMALRAGPEGTEFHAALARRARRLLAPGGSLLMELGAGQGEAVTAILEKEGYRQVRVLPDLAGVGRLAAGVRDHAG